MCKLFNRKHKTIDHARDAYVKAKARTNIYAKRRQDIMDKLIAALRDDGYIVIRKENFDIFMKGEAKRFAKDNGLDELYDYLIKMETN